jgi:glucosylceramidase
MTDGTYGYDNVNFTHYLAPEKLLVNTESCSCPGVRVDDWIRAERLGHDLLFDLQSHTQAYIIWNLLLDHTGGPNHVGNVCDAPLISQPDFSDIHIQPQFHYLGHFSKFIKPGAQRIYSKTIGNFHFQPMRYQYTCISYPSHY